MEMAIATYQRRSVSTPKDSFECSFWSKNQSVVGIDEVGRGCLAGPLVAAAVILPIGKTSNLLQDSKALDESERSRAYQWIIKHCNYQIGIVHNRIIDKQNIWHATILAMKRALVHLIPQIPLYPGVILVDAMPLKLEDTGLSTIPVYYFTQGESRSSSIAAASIIAKVTRDALMQKYTLLFPGYHLEKHKGYATKKHQDSIFKQNYLIIHRQSFLNFYFEAKKKNEQTKQQTICGNY